MSHRFTIQILEDLLKSNKIRGYIIKGELKGGESKKSKKGSKIKDWIELNLKAWAEANSLVLEKEKRFDPVRKWRFDWAFSDELRGLKVGLEYEGIFSKKSRHTTLEGYTGDSDKYRAAAIAGWTVLRYTAKNYKSIIEDLNKLI